MTTLLIKNGHVVDPANKIDEPRDILVKDGKIAEVSKKISVKSDEEIDAKGLSVTPGLIDLQVHFREPGREDRETIETGAKAALAGGLTSVVTMPNLSPAADDQTVIEFIINRAKQLNLINVYPAGAITKGQLGKSLAEINEMKEAGAVAVTDDGVDVQNEDILRRALQYTKTCDIVLMSHCETETLTGEGVMHEGWVSTQLGLPGVTTASEDLAVQKNIILANLCNARLHLLHNSTAGVTEAIRAAKKVGRKNITAEVSVQHFSMTEEECFGYNTNAKMYPPLRSKDHVEAIIEGIKDDTYDAFTTDHAPHIEPDKLKPMQDAAFGTIGVETSFAIMNTFMVEAGHIDFAKGISKMTIEPAKIIGIDKGTLSVGADADIAIFDRKQKWVVDSRKGYSKANNCLFNGKEFTGKPVYTIHAGQLKYAQGKIVV